MDQIEKLRYLIKAVDVEGEKRFARLLQPLAVTPTQLEILKILYTHGQQSVSEIGHLLICGSDNPSRVIQRLLLKKLIVKRADEKDGRKNNILLTDLGRQLLAQARAVEDQFNDQITQQLTDVISVDDLTILLSHQVIDTATMAKISSRERLE